MIIIARPFIECEIKSEKRTLEVENDPPEGNFYLGLFLVIFTYWKYNLYPLAHRFDRA